MDSVEVTKKYMAEYNKLIEKYESKATLQLVEDINAAIEKSDIANINTLYHKLSAWNEYVSGVQGARIALNTQFKHIKLPSVAEFLIVFDNVNKEWRFNTEAD